MDTSPADPYLYSVRLDRADQGVVAARKERIRTHSFAYGGGHDSRLPTRRRQHEMAHDTMPYEDGGMDEALSEGLEVSEGALREPSGKADYGVVIKMTDDRTCPGPP